MTIAIGGLGGSGTRVFAATLQHLGIRIGACLNQPLDNLWFTVLFKRQQWLTNTPNPADVKISTELFVRAMTKGLKGRLSEDEQRLLRRLQRDLPPSGSWLCGAKDVDAQSLLESETPIEKSHRWGWKEPNTHLFLPGLNARIPEFKYIHVVRNGLDMAFSKNTWQARHWSHFYGLPYDQAAPLPVHQLRYWIRANRVALDYGAAHMPNRFLAICYEDFCRKPAHYIKLIGAFLGVAQRNMPVDLVKPSTIGRRHQHDLSIFSAHELEQAHEVQNRVSTRV